MASDQHAPRPIHTAPPRYARGWCPECLWWLETQFSRSRVPDSLVCHGCHRSAVCASAGRCPLKGSHPATAVWEG